ncbi:YdaS family helix-turn-helix protein [Diaphorobacter ruginosibacter]|uniref:YdaS family helix-turn-helix protein n=1 Tax=Diaphorobacter ruginosibacter TaxID=1715720 RepID=UPI00333F919E
MKKAKISPQQLPSLRLAIQISGSQKKLASIVNKAQGHVSHWLANGLPCDYAPAIEKETGVSVEELCPQTVWLRVPDPLWPHPGGRPLIDVANSPISRGGHV